MSSYKNHFTMKVSIQKVFLTAIICTWLLSLFAFAGFLFSDWRWSEEQSYCTQDYQQTIAKITSVPFIVVRHCCKHYHFVFSHKSDLKNVGK